MDSVLQKINKQLHDGIVFLHRSISTEASVGTANRTESFFHG
uniref:Uncharacterized protein n=1 Tax=Anguilla anguilla TaxID=7936 RepID=A0A0E9WM69_ANGAN